MNILYLHKKSRWGCNELRYSLRSVEKYADFDRIYVAGYNPDWLKNVVHVPCKNKDNKFEDSNYKLKVGLQAIPKGEKVLLMHDDMFLLKSYKPVRYYNGTLQNRIDGMQSSRKQVLQRAFDLLHKHALHFSLHYPMPFVNNGWEHKDISFMNVLGNRSEFPKRQSNDCKFNLEAITKEKLNGLPCFSTASENDRLLHLFEQLYPNKSQFEH